MSSSVPSRQVYPAIVPNPFTDVSEPPIMSLDGLYVTEMVVVEDVCGETVFFLGTGRFTFVFSCHFIS